MKVAIIGAGVSGLTSLKYLKESGHECDVLEQTDQLGGTWVYTDKYGMDDELSIHRVMYKDLVTNIPKELMQLPDFPYPTHVEDSYISRQEVLKYIRDFASKFDLEKHIHYNAKVTKVEPNDEQWIVRVMDVETKEQRSECYDAVFICNGSFLHARTPSIEGQNLFQGLQMHSRDYRTAELYENKKVLIIGGSFSACDISRQIAIVAKNVCISYWNTIPENIANVIIKPGVKRLYNTGALFVDGSKENFDVILYCTGYKHFYPFLTKECGISVEDNFVRHLYKHIINIERPSLYFIGLPTFVPVFPMCDTQVRFAVAALDKKFVPPSKQAMRKDLDEDINKMKNKNVPQRHFHDIGFGVTEYYADLCQIAGLRSHSESFLSLQEHVLKTIHTSQRNTKYVLVDEKHFIEIK
ncbi:hypothetical protein RI129_003928 [Pyrocoelia pectoralis]|uniref:Flavin-containing monooxygenase n=1 Tax=Pyrocoelia pectoralis TaxID=417401 RepID=A0AAN7VRD7_9COLE